MIDSLKNLIFRCAHRRMVGPMARVRKAGETRVDSYLVCLDCGKQFPYDTITFQIGKPAEMPEPERRIERLAS